MRTSDAEDASLATRAVRSATWDSNDASTESVDIKEAAEGCGEAAELTGGGERENCGAERRVLEVGRGRREGEVNPSNAKLDRPKRGLEGMMVRLGSRRSDGMVAGECWEARGCKR